MTYNNVAQETTFDLQILKPTIAFTDRIHTVTTCISSSCQFPFNVRCFSLNVKLYLWSTGDLENWTVYIYLRFIVVFFFLTDFQPEIFHAYPISQASVPQGVYRQF
jgi:hypothetical protein